MYFENSEIREYDSFTEEVFRFASHTGHVIYPENFGKKCKWIWRTEFLGAFDYLDLKMLKSGYALVYYGVSDMYGCPESIKLMKNFRDYIVEKLDLFPECILEGFSRGGLYACNYAYDYPEDASLLYLDAPVLDIFSWPGGKGTGEGSEECFRECLTLYGITENDRDSFSGDPVSRFEKLSETDIPVIIVAGKDDTIVPMEENCLKMVKYYNSKGKVLKLIAKENCGHHPHSLEDPSEIYEFIRKYY